MDPLLQAECDNKRAEIIRRAMRLVNDGAHYLWGANGAKPGSGGIALKVPVLDVGNLDQTTFCAAALNGCVCVGRFRAKGVVGLPPSEKVWNPENGNTDLVAFIGRVQNTPNAQVGWGADLTPRRIFAYPNSVSSPTDYGGGSKVDLPGKVVWGEGCDDTQHFDCGGFVRYVVQEVCHLEIRASRLDLDEVNVSGEKKCVEVAIGDAMLPGDILLYTGHVAFAASAAPSYNTGDKYAVVQAESAVYGVNCKARGGDIKCMRLSPSSLLGRKVEK